MLQSINDRIQGWLGWVIVAFISVPFALWGIQSYLDVGANKFVAKVNDTEITPAQFDRALSQQRARMQQMFGKNMPKSDAYDKILKEQVLNQLIATEALNQYANDSGYAVADASLAAAIRSIDAFKENGQFSQDLYEKVLNSQGMSLAGFEAMYRQELSSSHIQNAIMSSAIITESDVAATQALKKQQRNISYVTFSVNDYVNKAQVSAEEAKQYFQQNTFRYMNPEQVSIQYIELKSEQLENEVPVSSADIQKSYDTYVANAKANEQRKARHILVSLSSDAGADEKRLAEEKIKKVEKELASGAKFSALAKKYSDDEGSAENGGDLGLVSKGMMVKPFEEALFKLKKGQISGVIRSEFGFHIVRLDEIQSEKVETLAAKKSSIEKELKESGVQNLFFERAELLANLAYENPEGLDLVAEQLKLDIKKSKLFSRNSGTGIASHAKVRNMAFENNILKENLNSDAVEISNKHVVVIRINEHKLATSKSFDAVKAGIIAELKSNKARQMARDDAAKLAANMSADNSFENWKKQMSRLKAASKTLGLVTRDSDKSDKQLLQSAFKLSKPETTKVSFKQIALNSGDAAVIAVSSVKDISDKPAKADAGVLTQLNNQLANKEFTAVVAAIRENAEIYIPEKKAD
ncbi:MAG: SurA N-terminal domain-containing protein [Gammaproteobacteria bacterium]|nr:SurA N-terminal domain-containing protein [Gammaproteobacteria bacterium]